VLTIMASPLDTDMALRPASSTPTAILGEPSQAQNPTLISQTQSRRADEQARKDRTLVDFMTMLDDYEPLIPSEVTEYYLQRVGFECEDVRMKRLLSLAAQKFVSDIASDAYQHARIRTNAQPASRVRQHASDKATTTVGASAPLKDRTKTILTMDDLGAALTEYGINARKPDFFL